MTHSFVAYIDESGDDGLAKFREPGGQGGASQWLVISACVWRQTHDLAAVQWRDAITAKMPERRDKKGRPKRDIHFKDLGHGQRTMVAQNLSELPLRGLSVAANKLELDPANYPAKNQLYFYLTRYLIERLSWLCRDMRPTVPEGDGKVKVTFSRRGGMQYDAFRDYLRRLKNDDAHDIRIHWPVIDIDAVDALDHSRSASLQLADCFCSSIAAAFERDRYGNCEPRYAETVKRIVYQRKGNYLSYGMKTLPHHSEMQLVDQQRTSFQIFK